MRYLNSQRIVMFIVVVVGFVFAFANTASAVVCQQPMYGKATVDGNYSEWNLNPDFFADMHQGWDKPTVLSKLYLRYDCAENIMYALVLTTNHDRTLYTPSDPDTPDLPEAWIKIDNNYAVHQYSASFSWIDKVGNLAVGWEASFPLAAGQYGIKAHSNVWWGGESQTSGTGRDNISICISCPVLGAIGDYVWHDINLNGLQDDGLMSVVGIPNITVRLMKEDAQGSVNDEYSQVTDANGWYLFADLPAGTYFVDVDERDEDMPTDAAGRTWIQTMLTGENKHDPHRIVLADGEVYLQADFGFAGLIDPALGTIGDYTWWDDDDNNEQWHVTPPQLDLELPYIIVELYTSPGNVLCARGKTDRYGNYLFYDVPFGSYVVRVDEAGPAKPYLVESLSSTVKFGDIGDLAKLQVENSPGSLGKINDTKDTPYWEAYNWQFTGTPPYGNNHQVTIDALAPNYLAADFPYLEDVPIVVELVSFKAVVGREGVRVSWQTGQESNVAGYNLLCRESDGGFAQVNERLIAARGSATNGADYEYVDVIDEAGTYIYKIAQIELDGRVEKSDPVSITITSAVFESLHKVTDYALYPNHPNPFNPQTTIEFSLPKNEQVTLNIYDISGRLVKRLVNGLTPAGAHTLIWDGLDDHGLQVSSGTYIYRMVAGKHVETQKMTLVR